MARRAVLDRSGICHFGEQIRDFADTAALIELMDLVIAVDTSIAHAAGALGKPVWILVAFSPIGAGCSNATTARGIRARVCIANPESATGGG